MPQSEPDAAMVENGEEEVVGKGEEQEPLDGQSPVDCL